MAGSTLIGNLRPNGSVEVELDSTNTISGGVDNRWDAVQYTRTAQGARGITCLSTAQNKRVKITDWKDNTITIIIPDNTLEYGGSVRYLEFIPDTPAQGNNPRVVNNPDQIIFHYYSDE